MPQNWISTLSSPSAPEAGERLSRPDPPLFVLWDLPSHPGSCCDAESTVTPLWASGAASIQEDWVGGGSRELLAGYRYGHVQHLHVIALDPG